MEQNIGVTGELSNGVSIEQGNGITNERYNNRSKERTNDSTVYQHTGISLDLDNKLSLEQNNNRTIDRNNVVSLRAPTKNELEMFRRTRKPSDKMILQELMKKLLKVEGLTVNDMITKAKKAGLYFLFNQASTGKVTGITYFYNDFKAKGQALGNQFKWAEIIKIVNYEQDRDSEAIRQENELTKSKFDNSENGHQTSLQPSQDKEILISKKHGGLNFGGTSISIQIARDEDDAKKHRRKKHSHR